MLPGSTASHFLSPKVVYDCTANNLKIAEFLREDYLTDGRFRSKASHSDDVFIGYPGGACGFVRTQEACQPGSQFDFLQLYYCSLTDTLGYGWYRILAGGLVINVSCLLLTSQGFVFVVAMYNLASTADLYLSPSLERMTVKLGLSESIAGVTLLAFGNGAADVLVAFSAAEVYSGPKAEGPAQLGNALL